MVLALREQARRLALRAAFPRREPLVRVGSEYGGWHIPIIRTDWVCCTVGVGEDATFDVALAGHGCRVIAVDPTPRAIEYMRPILATQKRLQLEPVAVWTEETDLSFFPPKDPQHVSFSATNLQGTRQPIKVPAKPLPAILQAAGVDQVDLLKLDIEGAEYAVLERLNLDALGARILCVEYHFNGAGLPKMIRAIRSIERRGWRVAYVRHTNVTFLRIKDGLRRP